MLEKIVIFLVISITLYLYWFYKQAFICFKQRNIPYIEPRIIFGNITESFFGKKSITETYVEIYRKLEPHRVVGLFNFHKPSIMIRDPKLLKSILIKDFANFSNRGFTTRSKDEPLSNHLFNMEGEMWKNLRIKLTPTFSTGKMKIMFPLVQECCENLIQVLFKLTPNNNIDVMDLCSRLTADIIGTCAFGLETNTLQNPESEFRQIGKEIGKNRIQTLIRTFLPHISPKIVRFFNLYSIDRKVDQFFFSLVQDTIKYREDKKITRNDFLDLLINLKNNTDANKLQDEHVAKDLEKFLLEVGNKCGIKSNIEMTDDLLVAQVFIFFLAGFETSSSAISFLLFELALNPHIQNKLRTEITKILGSNGNKLTYDIMKKMKYADMVIAETFRKHPISGVLIRKSSKNYVIPDTNILLKENEDIIIPVHAFHTDEKYFEKPNEFYPQHFTMEAIASRPHFSYLPFGEGPRMCIAVRFAQMGIKAALVYFLENFSYHISPKMTLPIKYSPNMGTLGVEGGIWLNCKKI